MAASFASLLVKTIDASGVFKAARGAAGSGTAAAGTAIKEKIDSNPVAKQGFSAMQDMAAIIKTQYKRGHMATGGQLSPMGALTGGVMGKAMFGMMGKVGITKMMPNMSKLVKGMLPMPNKLLGKAMGMLGINLSLSTLLRQSQLFTGILGALFQILGGFVDVILAPFMPLFVKVIQMLAAQIPKVREYAQKAYDWLDQNVFPIIRRFGSWVWDKVKGVFGIAEGWMPIIKEKLIGVWAWAKQFQVAIQLRLMQTWEWFKTHLLPTLIAAAETVWGMIQTLWEWAKTVLWPAMKASIEVIKGIIEHLLGWLREEIYPRIGALFDWIINNIGTFIVEIAQMFIEWMGRIVPIITSILTQIIDILVGQILMPLWEALEPILKWWVSFWMTNIEWFLGIVDSKILPAISQIIDIIWPHVKNIIDAFKTDVMPVIDEAAGHIREFLEALLDVLIPILKILFKVAFWVLEKIFKILFKILAIVWKYVIGPIFKILTWLLRLPYRWRSQVVDPVMGVLEGAWEELKFFGSFLKEIPNLIDAFFLLLAKWGLELLGKLPKVPFFGDLGKKFREEAAAVANARTDKLSGLNELRDSILRSRNRRAFGPSEAGYGGALAVTINNVSAQGVVDDSRKFVVDADEDREIENMQNDKWNFGAYSSMDANIKV